jgi:hypothetical protein
MAWVNSLIATSNRHHKQTMLNDCTTLSFTRDVRNRIHATLAHSRSVNRPIHHALP